MVGCRSTLYTLTVHSDDKAETAAPMESEYEVPYLGAEEVIDEVITLLARLERDRVDSKKALEQENQRSRMLKGKIDGLAVGRAEQLPVAVQAGRSHHSGA